MPNPFKSGPDPRRGKGGARPGAGRPKGSTNHLTAELRKKILDSGKSPLEMMVDITRWHYRRWKVENRRPPDQQNEDRLMAKAKAVIDAAREAAPYLHSKMPTALEVAGKDGGPIQHVSIPLDKMTDEELAALEPVIAALAAAGDLAGADPGGEDEEAEGD